MQQHPIDDYIEATFAGKTWKLSLGLRAEVEFERLRKKDIGPVLAKFIQADGSMNMKGMLEGFSAEDFCALLWAMTLRYQERPGIPFEKFVDLLSLRDLKSLFDDVMQAAGGSYGLPHKDDPAPQAQEKNGDPLDPAAPPIGTPSGPCADSTSG